MAPQTEKEDYDRKVAIVLDEETPESPSIDCIDQVNSSSKKGESKIEDQTTQDVFDSTYKTTDSSTCDSELGLSSTSSNGNTALGDDCQDSFLNVQLKQMLTTADWWSLWIGLISFTVAVCLVFIVPYDQSSSRVTYVIPQPMRWMTDPLNAWDIYSIIGTILLWEFLGCMYLISLRAMGKVDEQRPASMYARGFLSISFVATIALWIGRNQWCYKNGFGYAIFSILMGMAIGNSPLASGDRLSAMKLASKDGEFFIKCSLSLLAVEFSILGDFGPGALLVAWVGSPLALVAGLTIGMKFFNMEKGSSLLIATGATWCGASAISAIGSVIGSPNADITLSISVIAFFTVIFTFLQPYIALGVGMDHRVAGAWIGGSVDQTGNVVASAAIISEEATEVAAIVKIVLNSGLGVLAMIVAFLWQRQESSGNAETKPSKFSWTFLWNKFPKFVIGYILCSATLSIIFPLIRGTAQADALQRAVISMNTWWFAIAFVGIGMETKLGELWNGATKSGIVKLYLITNLLDMLISLGLAYLAF